MLPNDTDLFAVGELYRAKGELTPVDASPEAFRHQLLRVPRVALSGGRYWLHVSVTPDQPGQWTMGRFGSFIENITLYVSDGERYQTVRTGQFERDDYALHYGADFEMQAKPHELWLLIDSRYFTGVPTAHLLPRTTYGREVLLDNLLVIGCLGSILILALYNFLLAGWMQSRDYLFYALYLVSTFIGWAAVFKVFAQTLGWTHPALILLPFYLNIVANTLFYRNFLMLDQDARYLMLCRYGNAVTVVTLILAGLSFVLPLWSSYLFINLMTIFWLGGGLVGGMVRWLDGYKPARFYIAGFACMSVGGSLVVFPYLGLPRLTDKEYMVTLVAQTLDVLLLAIALADRINLIRKEKSRALEYAREVDQKATQVLLGANEKLHEALQLSEENQRHKDQFVMAVSHELRTPLNAITGSLGPLMEARDEKEKALLHQFIQFGTDRLSTQVENLIMLAETEQQKIRSHQRRFCLASLLARIEQLARAHLFNKPVVFSIIRHGLTEEYFLGDDYLLIRMLVPVLENACKLTERGSVTLTVDVSESGVRFCFSDTGPGIAPDMKERMFESFTQASMGYQRTHQGLGIGLTVCQRIASLLSATIQLESEIGAGAEFCLDVPLTIVSVPAGAASSVLAGHALIVEDNEINARVLNALMKKIGFTTDLAVDGALALECVKANTFDVVLMDLQMPVMDGFASAQAMRKLGVRCPIIAVTANSDYEARIRCLDVGMNDFMNKPINRDILQEKLRQWLQAG